MKVRKDAIPSGVKGSPFPASPRGGEKTNAFIVTDFSPLTNVS